MLIDAVKKHLSIGFSDLEKIVECKLQAYNFEHFIAQEIDALSPHTVALPI